jgi:hypothetical protein
MSKYSRRRPAGLKIGDTSAQEITEIMRCFAPGFGYAEE